MRVRVTFVFEPEPEEIDEDDPTGLTADAFERLMDQLVGVGATDVEASKA